MTNDKIKHYIGEQVFNHIAQLNEPQLSNMKNELIQDMNAITHEPQTLFKRTIELTFIKQRLGE